MSAFSRGCLRQHALRPFQINTFQPIHPRFFNTTSSLCTKKPRSKPPSSLKSSITAQKSSPPTSVAVPKSTFPKVSPSLPSIPYSSAGYANTLSRKAHPTLLYEAPSHVLFMVSAYTAAFTCYGWSTWAASTMVLNPPPGLAQWIPYAFGGVAIMMSALGTWLIFGTARCIRSITAIPKRADQISKALNKSPIRAGAQSKAVIPAVEAEEPEIEIEVVIRKMFPIPFFPARVLYLKPGDITLSSHLSPPAQRKFTVEELRQTRLEEQARLEQEKEFARNHILTMPFRLMTRAVSQAFFEAFRAFKKAWSRDGLIKVIIKGQSYKLDVSGGWMLDNGRAIDRLAKIKQRI